MSAAVRRDQRSPEALAYRHLYKTARWLKLRQHQIAEHPLCAWHLRRGHVVRATTVHHVEPHHGNEVLFYNGPFESLCSECHSSAAQSAERRGYSTEVGVDGWPIDAEHPANRTSSCASAGRGEGRKKSPQSSGPPGVPKNSHPHYGGSPGGL